MARVAGPEGVVRGIRGVHERVGLRLVDVGLAPVLPMGGRTQSPGAKGGGGD